MVQSSGMESPDFTCSGINCSEKKKSFAASGQLHVIWTKRCTSYLKIHLIWVKTYPFWVRILGLVAEYRPQSACVTGMLGRLLRSAPLRTAVVGSVCVHSRTSLGVGDSTKHLPTGCRDQSSWQDHFVICGWWDYPPDAGWAADFRV